MIRFAFNLNHSIMGFDDTFNDGQSQTGSDNVSRFFIFYAIESVKNSVQILLCNSEPGIADTDAQVVFSRKSGYGYLPFSRCIVYRIGNQIGKHFFHVLFVCKYRR